MEISPIVRIGFPFDYIDLDPYLVNGEGMYVYDQNGKRYLDLNSGIWNVPFGYGEIRIQESMIKQMKKYAFCNLIQNQAEIQVQYAKKLCKFLGDFKAVAYTCSGSEAVEAAIKSCRKYQVIKGHAFKKSVCAFDLSYHGTSYGAMSVSGIDQEYATDYHPLLPGIQWIKVPEDVEDEEQWIRVIEEHFNQYKNEMAGVIVEPVFASGGIVKVPESAMQKLQQLCNKEDILFVVDEVATGFGRTGYPFAFQGAKIQPDLICLSKAINNGNLPLGVVAFRSEIAGAFAKAHETLEHFSTQGGNLIAIAAADTVLDIMQDYDAFHVKEKGEKLLETLRNVLGPYPVKVRGVGLMLAIEFDQRWNEQQLQDILEKMKKLSVLAYAFNNPGHNIGISIFPPFIIDEADFTGISKKIERALKQFL